jgi:hypothetical protein
MVDQFIWLVFWNLDSHNLFAFVHKFKKKVVQIISQFA